MKSYTHKFGRSAKAFMMVDVVTGLFILAMLASLLAIAVNLRVRNSIHLANQRRALHAATLALVNLQSASPLPLDPAIKVDRSGKKIGNLEWVEVTATHEGRRQTVMGLAKPTTGVSP